jgi:hypothetical protein
MFAMAFSFLLSRTLVPTMALYMLRPHAPHTDLHGNNDGAPPSRNPLVRFQRGFEERFERVRDGYRDVARRSRSHIARLRRRLHGLRAGELRAGAVPRSELLPRGRRRADPDPCAVPVGTRVEESPCSFAQIEKAIRTGHPVRRDRRDGRQHRHAGQQHQPHLQQHRRDRHAGRRHPDRAAPKAHAPTAEYVRRCAATAAGVPGHDLLVPAGRHRQPDPELRRAGADRPAGARS